MSTEIFFNSLVGAIEKTAGDRRPGESEDEWRQRGRTNSTLVGSLFGPFAGLAANKGRGWRTAGGALVGRMAGSHLGQLAGRGHPAAAVLGSIAGGGLGAHLAHGGPKRKKNHEKTAEVIKEAGIREWAMKRDLKKRQSRNDYIAAVHDESPWMRPALVGKRAVTGGLLGGAIGYAAGKTRPHLGAAIGAGVGGLAGGALGRYESRLITQMIADRKKKKK